MILASISNFAVDISLLADQDVQIPQNGGDGKLMLIFMGIAAISLLVLALLAAGALVALVVAGIKAKRSFGETVREVKGRAYPLIEKSTGLVSDLAPVIRSAAVKADALITDLTPTIKGIAEKTHVLIGEVSPKVEDITDDLHRISSSAKRATAQGLAMMSKVRALWKGIITMLGGDRGSVSSSAAPSAPSQRQHQF
ncbi:hypothetical protein [Granulicella sibirica]|uniref:hypothetical protein n=1 Tax=Granulicella sibirica TaxID=2479048 RepID=UPI001008C506|nr:hypothetical protein [Granulicella sibirica]